MSVSTRTEMSLNLVIASCPVATALHLKVASGGNPLESRQVVSHPFINLLNQPQELLNVDRLVLVPDSKGFHMLHELCLGQGEVRAPSGAEQFSGELRSATGIQLPGDW